MGFYFDDIKAGKTAKASVPKSSGMRRTHEGVKIGDIPIRVLGEKSPGCSICTLNAHAKQLRHPRMLPTGSKDPVIYILGEAPGKNEDEQGEQFIGASGKLIRDFIPEELDPYIRWSNTVRCRPPDNRTPVREEIIACSQYNTKDIEATKPAVIMGFGAVPLRWATDQTGILDWRGRLVPIRVGSHRCWYAPIWHPAFIGRAKNDGKMGSAIYEQYKKDLKRVFDLVLSGELEEPYIPEGEELSAGMHWELSWDLEAVKHNLEELSQYEYQSVDIETNGLRPYAKDSKILTISFGTWERSYAIPVKHRESKWTDAQIKKLWQIIGAHMRQKHITFVAHQLSFEQEWLSMPWALGKGILFEVNWGDTMAQAETLRTQSMESKGLDACSVAAFGVHEKILDAVDRAKLDAEPLPKVLRYNARDTKFTDLVHSVQAQQIEAENLATAYGLMVSRVPALVLAQQGGVLPNYEFAEAKHKELEAAIDALEHKIQELPEVRQMVRDKGTPFNSGSSQQLTILLRDYLKAKEGYRKVKGGVTKYSTDEATLTKIKHPIAQLILEQRSLVKLDGTYVIGSCRRGSFPKAGELIWADGLIHTSYNYLIARTGRLSSDSPNLQNYPKREHKEIRNCITAGEGEVMVPIDYGQIEARVIAMASQCPVLCEALWNHYDIHMAWAEKIANAFPYVMKKYLKESKGDEKKAMKLFRSDIKNQWTFPQFFGSVLAPIADVLGIPERDLAPYSEEFWEMFEAVKKWQQKIIRAYGRTGYTQTLTGRRRYGPLSANEIINSPIQGTASDIVVSAMSTLARMSYEMDRPELAPRLNVHDDLTLILPEDKVESTLELAIPVMLQPEFDFINVPLTVEVSMGKTWGNVEDLFTVESTEYGFPLREAA